MKDCKPNTDCHFNKFRRPLYYHGMLIDEKGFRDEQEYHTQKRRLINRMVHGAGVVCGLELTKADDKTVTISCGLVLDCSGYEIYLPSDVNVKVPQPGATTKPNCAPVEKSKEICYRIRIAYTDEETDFEEVQLPGGSCGDKTCKPTRKREGYCLDLHPCDCANAREPFRCGEPAEAKALDYVKCACGCACSCGTDHWVSIGTVRVTDGKIVGDPTYDCRDYVFSGQMLKQLLTKSQPPTDECACPDQFPRFRELLALICKSDQRGAVLENTMTAKIDQEESQRKQQGEALTLQWNDALKHIPAVDQASARIDVLEASQKRIDTLEQSLKRLDALDTLSKRLDALEKRAKKPDAPAASA